MLREKKNLDRDACLANELHNADGSVSSFISLSILQLRGHLLTAVVHLGLTNEIKENDVPTNLLLCQEAKNGLKEYRNAAITLLPEGDTSAPRVNE